MNEKSGFESIRVIAKFCRFWIDLIHYAIIFIKTYCIIHHLLTIGSVPNYCQSVCPKQTTFEEDRKLFFSDFLQFHVYDLRFKAGGLTTFLTEFWTLRLGTTLPVTNISQAAHQRDRFITFRERTWVWRLTPTNICFCPRIFENS